MRLQHLSLVNFRNYVRLELDFPARITLVQGANAQGKTNLLEAIHYVATGRSHHAGLERELVNWLAVDDPLPHARVVAVVGHDSHTTRLEITLLPNSGPSSRAGFRKRIRINGVNRRALDLVGHLRVVLFVPQDIELVAGSPSRRRRYPAVALCQIDRAYCHALAGYNRVLAQRNALLRNLRERGGATDQLRFWDEQLAEHGAYLIAARARFIASLEIEARARHRELTSGRERLSLRALPNLELSHAARTSSPPLPLEVAGEHAGAPPTRVEIMERLSRALQADRARDIAAGMTLIGPHRDDMQFIVGGRDLRIYGSRGQQRTAALALKLAEVQVMTQETGDPPVLLLDDVMSELDADRRRMLLAALEGIPQAIITTTEWEAFTPAFRARARLLRVIEGRIEEVAAEGV